MKAFKSVIPIVAASAFAVAQSALPSYAQSPTPAVPPATSSPAFVVQQPPGEWLASLFYGQDVTNAAGEKLGDVSDLVFDKTGRISTVVIGVGGIMGLGEKYVAVPFDAITVGSDAKGLRIVSVALTSDSLQRAPAFVPSEKTTFTKAKEKAGELIDQAGKRIEEMRKDAPKQQ